MEVSGTPQIPGYSWFCASA